MSALTKVFEAIDAAPRDAVIAIVAIVLVAVGVTDRWLAKKWSER